LASIDRPFLNHILKLIDGVPAKSQFLQFYSQQSYTFFRLPAEKDSYCSCVIDFYFLGGFFWYYVFHAYK
jgi:hypothetical protein